MAEHNLRSSVLRILLVIFRFYIVSGYRHLSSRNHVLLSHSEKKEYHVAISRSLESYLTRMYRASDVGDSWIRSLEGSCQPMVTSFNKQTILASCRHGLFRSLDHSQSWIALSPTRADALFISPGDQNCLLMKDGDLFVSEDIGSTWNTLYRFPSDATYSLAASNNSRIIAVVSNTDGLYLSTDKGVSWATKLQGLGFTGDSVPLFP